MFGSSARVSLALLAFLSVYVLSTPAAATDRRSEVAAIGDASRPPQDAGVDDTDASLLFRPRDIEDSRHHLASRVGVLGSSVRAGLAYRFALVPRLEVEVQADHVFPHPGLRHLRAFTQSAGAVVWFAPTRSGLFLSPVISVGETYLVITPKRRVISFGGGASGGLSLPVFDHATFEIAAGLRRFRTLAADPSVCTDPSHCELTRADWLVDATVALAATW